MWETIAVYERAIQQGHSEDDVAQYTTWADVMIVYGVKRNHKEGIDDIPPEATDRQPDAAPSKHGKRAVATTPLANRGKKQPDKVDDVLPEEQDKAGGDDWEDGSDDDEQKDQIDPDLPEKYEPSIPDADMDAAAAYVEQVGSLPYAARVLAITGIRSGDKEMLQNALKEMIRAAQIILSRAEINEIAAPAPYSDNKPKKRRNTNRLDNCHTDCERTPREIAALGHKVMPIDLDPAFCEAANTVVHADKSFSPAERLPRIDWSHEEFVENERS